MYDWYDLSGVLSKYLEAGSRGLPGSAALSVAECYGLATVGGVQHSGSHLKNIAKNQKIKINKKDIP